MKNEVKVVKPKNYPNSKPHSEYPIITIGRNEEYGSIMLRQEKLVIAPGTNIMNIQPRTAQFAGRIENLEKMVQEYGLKEGDNFSKKVTDVELIVEESHEPFYEGQEPKINPSTGEVVTSDGQEVYRQTFIKPKSEEANDKLLTIDREPVKQTQATEANTEFAQQ